MFVSNGAICKQYRLIAENIKRMNLLKNISYRSAALSCDTKH